MALFRMSWGVGNAFFEDIAYLQLSKSCFPLRAGSILSKDWTKNAIRRGVKAQKYKKKADDAQTNENFRCVADKHFCRRGPGGEKCTGLQPKAIF